MAVLEVIVGTYNHLLVGLEFTRDIQEEKEWCFHAKFTDQGHDGCIKTVATGGKFLASGSSDETIRLYDLNKHVELGSLVQQSGSITEIAFSGSMHMLSASEDGTICVWNCKSWDCVKTLKGHRDSVTSISVHPTGRLALSVSKDKTIKTWNLLTGRTAYTTNIKQVGEIVMWSPNGGTYVVVSGSKATVYKISNASEACTIDCEKMILAVTFLTDDVLVLAGEAAEVSVFDIRSEKTLQKFKAHDIRVKALQTVDCPDDANGILLFTTASDGTLKCWKFDKQSLERHPELLAEFVVPGRPTCLTVKVPGKSSKSKRDRKKSKHAEVTEELAEASNEGEVSEEFADAGNEGEVEEKLETGEERDVKLQDHDDEGDETKELVEVKKPKKKKRKKKVS